MYLFTKVTDCKGEHKATIVKTKKLELVNVCQDRHCPIIFCNKLVEFLVHTAMPFRNGIFVNT